MFFAGRWASAFVDASGTYAGEGLRVLKALIPAIGRVSGVVSGTAASLDAARILRTALIKAGFDQEDRGMKFALGTVVLLIKKNRLKYGDLVIREIEKALDQKNGVLPVTVETASPLDAEFQHTLGELLKQKTGAREIRFTITGVPELLAGCKLRMGSASLDASLRGQIQKMAADLSAAGGFSW
ncbi:MAG: F0F1 ATP synthase subunit delta [Spirochaetaceae bacterium]|jgi:F-type H+-transporting ATPase subunit delta|nr:F0F1 ATP synthase subunit delta [Spirochaetaceae bacterium]